MTLLDLSDELLDLCFASADKISLRMLRLTARRILPVSTKRLFSHVTIWPTDASAEKCRLILEDTKLNPLVKRMTFNSSNNPDQDRWDYQGPKEPELPNEYTSIMRKVGLFQNLQAVDLRYAKECAGPGEDIMAKEVSETEVFRGRLLKALVRSLNDKSHPAVKVRELSIKNLQNIVNKNINEFQAFRDVMSRLSSLSLSIVTEHDDAAPEHSIEIDELHPFFNTDLKEYWLTPVQSQLTHLKLYADAYWGYFPSCDLRDLHFPKLKYLALGNFSFTHDWQLDWILSHADTLETLILDDCPIIHGCYMFNSTGPDREPPKPQDYNLGDKSTWLYDARWYDYFRRIKVGLPNLKHFGCGHGDWLNETAFETADSLPAELTLQRYCIFDGGIGPSPWVEPRPEYRFDDNNEAVANGGSYDCGWEEAPSYPECDEKDQEALDELMEVISRRE